SFVGVAGAPRRNLAAIPPTAGAVKEFSSSSRLAQLPVGSNSLSVRYIVTGSSINPSTGGSWATPISSGLVTSALAYWSRSTSGAGGVAVEAASSVGVAEGSSASWELHPTKSTPARALRAANRTAWRFTDITPLRYRLSAPTLALQGSSVWETTR